MAADDCPNCRRSADAAVTCAAELGRVVAAERARADAAEARLRSVVGMFGEAVGMKDAVPRDVLAEVVTLAMQSALRPRGEAFAWSLAADAMAAGLAECERLRAALSDIGVAVLMGPDAAPEQCIGAVGGMLRNWRDADRVASERLGMVLAANAERRAAVATADALRAQHAALVGAVRAYVAAVDAVTDDHYEQIERLRQTLTRTPKDDAERTARAALDAMLTDGGEVTRG